MITDMKHDELEKSLRTLMDKDKRASFSIKYSEDPKTGLWIEANKNGILVFCSYLLKSINPEHLVKDSYYQIPDAFNDDAEISIDYIQIEEGNKSTEPKRNMLTQIGCSMIFVVGVLIFIAGLVSAFQWLTKILE